jgi:hypothetical protein
MDTDRKRGIRLTDTDRTRGMMLMDSDRKRGIVAGIFFLVAAAAAIAGLALYDPVLNDPGYVADASRTDARLLLGAFFEVLTVISVIGTGVALYPVIRRESEGLATGYLTGRVFEGTMIAVGLISLLAVAALRQDAAAGDGASLIATGKALVAVHDATFLLGPGLAIGINTLLLASVMYRSRLVPRSIAMLGLVGGPLVFASSTAVLFGAYEQVSELALLAAIPVFAWEMSLAVRLLVKGFDRSPARDHAVAAPGLGPQAAAAPA